MANHTLLLIDTKENAFPKSFSGTSVVNDGQTVHSNRPLKTPKRNIGKPANSS